jgi:hypothetical protein
VPHSPYNRSVALPGFALGAAVCRFVEIVLQSHRMTPWGSFNVRTAGWMYVPALDFVGFEGLPALTDGAAAARDDFTCN